MSDNAKKPYDKSCLMLDFNIDRWTEILDKISNDKIYNDETNQYGKEKEPHCTVMYGFDQGKEIVEQIKDICERAKLPISVQVKSISCFENKLFDVLKFDLESESLTKLNSVFKNFDITTDFPDYHAHMTIAYLNKGVIKNPKDFVIDLSDKNLVIDGNSFTFSIAKTTNKVKFDNNKINNILKGGKGDFAFVDDFTIDEITKGIKVEQEHTDNIAEALEIVLDHLTENKDYYNKLKDAGLADELNESIKKKSNKKPLLID
jgi:2'-5' RNA ligase